MSYKYLGEALLLGKPYFGTALRARQGVAERHRYCLPVVSSFPRHGPPLEIFEVWFVGGSLHGHVDAGPAGSSDGKAK